MLSFYLSFIQLWALLECTWLKCCYYLPIVLITVVVIDRHTEIKVNDRPPPSCFSIFIFSSAYPIAYQTVELFYTILWGILLLLSENGNKEYIEYPRLR
jgi:hypothetical protein